MAERPPPTEPAEPARRSVLERVGSVGSTAASLGGERSRWRQWAIVGLMVLAAIFLVLFVASQWSRLPHIRWRFRPGWLAVSIAALVVFQAIQAQLWPWILRGLGATLATSRAWSIFSVTLLARYVPTNLALVVGRTAMGEREGVPKRVTLAGVVYQLGLSFAGAAAVGAYFVIVLPDLRGQPVRFAALVLPVAALAVLHPRVFQPLADLALRRLGRERLPGVLTWPRVLWLTAVAAISFVVAGVAVYALAEAIRGVAGVDAPTVIGAYSVGFAASVLTLILPGGLGAREGVMVAALSPVMPAIVALAIALAIRLLQVGVEVVFATLTPVWARRSAAGHARA